MFGGRKKKGNKRKETGKSKGDLTRLRKGSRG